MYMYLNRVPIIYRWLLGCNTTCSISVGLFLDLTCAYRKLHLYNALLVQGVVDQ